MNKTADVESCEIFFFLQFKLLLVLKTRPAADTILHSHPSPPQSLEPDLKEESPIWWVSKMTLGSSYWSQSCPSHELTVPLSFRKTPHQSIVGIRTIPPPARCIHHTIPIRCKGTCNDFRGGSARLTPKRLPWSIEHSCTPKSRLGGLWTAQARSCWKECTRGWYTHPGTHAPGAWRRRARWQCIRLRPPNPFPSNASTSTPSTAPGRALLKPQDVVTPSMQRAARGWSGEGPPRTQCVC